ncbi:MAG: hypothetical protein J1F35_07390 [Erysipelotrichales bacterium]|nr:hypothetical protein [Erysipelotrichales bacterium]
METIIIGKPAMNVYLPLQEFPEEGDIFLIRTKNESVGNVGATSACLLAKWGMSTHFTGVTGNDAYAEKIRDTFKTYKVNSKFMETDFESNTAINYYILNAKSGVVTKILYNDIDSCLKKFKYDFIPNFAVIDGTDVAGAFALLNNNGSVKTVFYGRTGDKDTITLSKRCTWSVVTEKFCEMLTKMECDGSAEGYVNLYQKIVDVSGQSNYIVILNSHKILYCVDGKVKMLPEMKINNVDSSSFDSIFVGALSFALMNEVELDDAIKLANTAAAISQTKIGEVEAIPEIDEVLDNSGLREKLGLAKKQINVAATPVAVQPLNPNVTVNTGGSAVQVQTQAENIATTQDAFNTVPNMANQNVEMPMQATSQVAAQPQVVNQTQNQNTTQPGMNPVPMPEVQQVQNINQNV